MKKMKKKKAPWISPKRLRLCLVVYSQIFKCQEENEKFFAKFLGDGLRYALSDFVSLVNGNMKKSNKLTDKESVAICKIIDEFLSGENVNNINV